MQQHLVIKWLSKQSQIGFKFISFMFERKTQKCFKCHRKFAAFSIYLTLPPPMDLVPLSSYISGSQVRNIEGEEDTH